MKVALNTELEEWILNVDERLNLLNFKVVDDLFYVVEVQLLIETQQFFKFVAVTDDRTCDKCMRYDMSLMTRREIEDTFPYLVKKNDTLWLPNVHPNCRCMLILWEEEDDEQPKTDDELGKSYDGEYTNDPKSVKSSGEDAKVLDTFNKEFKVKVANAKELYRGVTNPKAVADLAKNGVVKNLDGTPVSFSINPELAQMYTMQDDFGATMVFDKLKVGGIVVPQYVTADGLPNGLKSDGRKLIDALPYWFADQEEVRSTNAVISEGGLKGIWVNSEKALDLYRSIFPDAQVLLIPKEIRGW